MPLLAPDPSRYRLDLAYRAKDSLTLSLTSRSDRSARPQARMEVLVTPVPAGFAPPGTCLVVQPGPAVNGFEGDAACRSIGPNRWQRADRDAVQLVERRGAFLVVVAGHLSGVSLADLSAVAGSLRPTTARALRAAART
ncbi:hypothetical protein Aph01nite_11930 [Acrocarpospora phusangensis]|uniref:Uncharacterized protein n=1 Tax=Acrocarpospora phusangensis TaxID=1070424 RepID=A0A919Q6L5_9ACTN|nr:hypothetical protein Aph01nite_11930 [Acrocarpospora phusangensis]